MKYPLYKTLHGATVVMSYTLIIVGRLGNMLENFNSLSEAFIYPNT